MLWHFFATGDTFSQEKAVAGPEKGAACYETMLGEAVPLAPSHPAFSPIELDPFDYLLVRFIQLIRLPPSTGPRRHPSVRGSCSLGSCTDHWTLSHCTITGFEFIHFSSCALRCYFSSRGATPPVPPTFRWPYLFAFCGMCFEEGKQYPSECAICLGSWESEDVIKAVRPAGSRHFP